MSTIPTRIGAGLAGLLATVGFALGPSAIASAEPAPTQVAASTQLAKGARQYVSVNQFRTGLATQSVDCGPASIVSAMLAQGYTPKGWSGNTAASKTNAVRQARIGIGHNRATNDADVVRSLKSEGVNGRAKVGAEGAMDAVRKGSTVIVDGYMNTLPYIYDYRKAKGANPNVLHWVTVSLYRPATNDYLLMDSNDGVSRWVTADQVKRFNNSAGGLQWQVVVS